MTSNKKPVIRHIILLFLLFLAGDLLSSIPFDLIFPHLDLPAGWMYRVPRILGCIILTLFLFWLYGKYVLHQSLTDFRITFRFHQDSFFVAVLLPMFVIAVYSFFGKATITSDLGLGEIVDLILSSLFYALKAGILEEILFRGFIMTMVEKRWNRYIAIVVPSLLFSLVHIPSMTYFSAAGCIFLIVSGTMVGIMFSLVAYKDGSIGGSILLHVLWNFVMATDITNIAYNEANVYSALFTISLPSDNVLLTGAGFGVEASIVAIIGYLFVCIWAMYKMKRN